MRALRIAVGQHFLAASHDRRPGGRPGAGLRRDAGAGEVRPVISSRSSISKAGSSGGPRRPAAFIFPVYPGGHLIGARAAGQSDRRPHPPLHLVVAQARHPAHPPRPHRHARRRPRHRPVLRLQLHAPQGRGNQELLGGQHAHGTRGDRPYRSGDRPGHRHPGRAPRRWRHHHRRIAAVPHRGARASTATPN